MIEKNFNFFFNPISKTKGIGPKIQQLFNEKKNRIKYRSNI